MPEPRTSSGKGLPGFSVGKESHRSSPSGQNAESGPTGRRDGMGWDGSTKNQQLQERSKRRFLADLSWAEKELPDEHGPFAAVAVSMERLGRRREPTAQEVLSRLRRTGRDRVALTERAERTESEGGNVSLPEVRRVAHEG